MGYDEEVVGYDEEAVVLVYGVEVAEVVLAYGVEEVVDYDDADDYLFPACRRLSHSKNHVLLSVLQKNRLQWHHYSLHLWL